MVYTHAVHGFQPVIDFQSRILILGSFPSVISRAEAFFYMNPKNRFWSVLSELYRDDFLRTDIEGKKRLLAKRHLSLYDVIESCDIDGSADASIRNIVPSDLRGLLALAPITHIFLNGSKAHQLFSRYFPEWMDIATLLPSTSAANARTSFPELLESWRILLSKR
jgi:TDG/mug DNA glycosylase family protein